MEPIVRAYNPQGTQPPLIMYQDDGQGNLVPVITGVAPPQGPGAPMQMPAQMPQPGPIAGPTGISAAVPGNPMSGGMPPVSPPMPPQGGPSGSVAPNPGLQTQRSPFANSSTPELDAAMRAGPAKTPEEAASRKGAWTQFAQMVQSNPQMQMLLLRLGSNLVQPVQPGQTPAGHLGLAVQDSMNYKAALDRSAIEARKTEADIGQTQAQTATEQQKPGLIQAQTTATQASMAKDQEETAYLKQNRGLMTQKLQGEINKLKADGQLDEARAKLFSAQAEKEPAKILEEIELMKAHSWYYRNPGAHARATEAARVQAIDNLAKAYVTGGNDELTKLYKTDPQTALSKAKVLAAAGQVAGFWNGQAEDAQADEIYKMYSDMYDTLNKTGSRQTKGQSKEEFIINQLMTANNPPSINSRVTARIGRSTKSGTAPQGGAKPPLSSFEK